MKRKEIVSDFPELQECDDQTYKNLKIVQKNVEATEPDIVEILNMEILIEDKVELFQLFEVYANVPDDVSLEKLELKKQINDLVSRAKLKYLQYKNYNKKEHRKIQKELLALEKYNMQEELKYSIAKLETNMKNKQLIYSEYKRMASLPLFNDESPKIKNWLRWSIALPYDKVKTTQKKFLSKILFDISQKMDEELYGMRNVKEQLLIYLNSRMTNPKMQKCSLGLLGAPGCGKTTIVKLLADIMDYPLEQISLGGVHSPEYLKGHQYTYIGSEPGEIVKCLCRMGVKNGILFFDEYDKIVNKEVKAALLYITDNSQNSRFQDSFLNGITIDLSFLWFIYSMNEKPSDEALSDRIFYIHVDGYSQEDKFQIVKNYILKKVHKNIGWKEGSLVLSDSAIRYLVEKVSPPEILGIRSLDYAVSTIANKVNFIHSLQDDVKKFKMSFQLDKKLVFPFVLEKEQVDRFLI